MIDTGAGVVDADYRGVVFVLLFNHSDTDFEGMRPSLVFGQSQRRDVSSGRRSCGTADSRENLYTRRGRGPGSITCASLALRTERDYLRIWMVLCAVLVASVRPEATVSCEILTRKQVLWSIQCLAYILQLCPMCSIPHTPTLIVQHTKHTIRDLPALRAALWPSQAASCGA
jgi:hypothetical protein